MWKLSMSERQNVATFLEHTTVRPFSYQQANFRCFYCNEIFPDFQSALYHTDSHTVPDRSFLLKNYLRKGKTMIKVDISSLKCRICKQKYSDLEDIRKHLIASHKKEFNAAGNGLMAYDLSTKNGLISCLKCSNEFNSFFLLNQHMNVHFSVVCETCGLSFMSHQRLAIHRTIHENGAHKCENCLEVFPTKSKLRYHIFKKHEVSNEKRLKPSKCTHCLERFSDHYKKVAHLKEVHGIIFEFECVTCKEVYPTRRALTGHTRKLHLQNIICKICGKCFDTYDGLKLHSRGHTGERNFTCAVCQKAYMHEKELRKHMKTHGYEATCLKCGNGFLSKTDLIKHRKQWHEEGSNY